MKLKLYLALAASTLLAMVSLSVGQEGLHQHHEKQSAKKDEAKKAAQAEHHQGVNSRGDHAMGFSHTRTGHHFRLIADGGAIEVSVKDPNDHESRDQIRRHLRHISELFAEGDFTKPMFTHGKQPPGADVMARLKSEITYRFESTEPGGRLLITTANKEALAAIHDFLRFQIRDHETGDSLEVESIK